MLWRITSFFFCTYISHLDFARTHAKSVPSFSYNQSLAILHVLKKNFSSIFFLFVFLFSSFSSWSGHDGCFFPDVRSLGLSRLSVCLSRLSVCVFVRLSVVVSVRLPLLLKWSQHDCDGPGVSRIDEVHRPLSLVRQNGRVSSFIDQKSGKKKQRKTQISWDVSMYTYYSTMYHF